mmetsp:Transcript_6749/g.12505  ORF Transcript_6749/g.12505 Transcript_6749/m.12505 type:complete len:205 (-) Transcript_6749:236-850(-)
MEDHVHDRKRVVAVIVWEEGLNHPQHGVGAPRGYENDGVPPQVVGHFGELVCRRLRSLAATPIVRSRNLAEDRKAPECLRDFVVDLRVEPERQPQRDVETHEAEKHARNVVACDPAPRPTVAVRACEQREQREHEAGGPHHPVHLQPRRAAGLQDHGAVQAVRDHGGPPDHCAVEKVDEEPLGRAPWGTGSVFWSQCVHNVRHY